jgi:hypothetical protein
MSARPVTAVRFELYRRAHSDYRFRIVAANGEIIAQSEGYTSKQAARDTIKLIQAKATIAEVRDLTND